MTIGTSTSRVSFACDGATKIFPVPIQAYLATDFTVILTAPLSAGGGEATLTLNSDYSLVTSGTLQPTAWTLTTLATNAYVTGYTLQVFCNPVQTQQTQYVQGQAFPSLAVQTNIDRLTQMAQRLEDQVSRSIGVPDGDVSPVMLLPIAAQRVNKALMFDASGNAALGVPNTQTITTALLASFLGLSQTAAEAAQGVTPVLPYPVGSFRRYGADPTGVAGSSTAITNAIKCNGQVFDDYPGGGNYLIDTEIALSVYPLRISGQIGTEVAGGSPNVGTRFTLATAAGANASHFHATVALQDIVIEHIGFLWQTCTTGQKAIRFDADTRQSLIQHCKFIWKGAQTNGNNLVGVQINGTVYSGGITLFGNLFSALRFPVNMLGPCTTIKVTNNELYGHACPNSIATLGAITAGAAYTNGTYNSIALTGGTGTGALAQITVAGGAVTAVVILDGGSGYTVADSLTTSNANIGGTGAGFAVAVATLTQVSGGIGIRMAYPTEGPVLTGNYLEGFSTAIYSEGASNVKQIGNDYLGANTPHHFVWVKTSNSDVPALRPGFSRIWNQAIGETYGAGDTVYPFNNNDFCVVMSSPGSFFVDATTASVYRGFVEQGRTVANGHQITRVFAAGNYTGGGGWTVTSGQVLEDVLVINGNEATYYFFVNGSSVTGGNPTLTIALPAGVIAASARSRQPCWISDNGATGTGLVEILSAGTSISIFKDSTSTANWSASTTNTSVAGHIKFPIQFSVN